MIKWKLDCRSRKQKRKNQPIARPGIEHCHWFILPLLLATPTMQFSLDNKRWSHKKNQCSASDSVGLNFTRSYRSTLLTTTPTATPSLVKIAFPFFFKTMLISAFLLRFKANYLEKMHDYPNFPLGIPITLAKICIFRVILTWHKNLCIW